MSKTNKSRIIEDHDGTYFCAKCGQAGFLSQPQGWGHLSQCKGYRSVLAKAKKEDDEIVQSLEKIENNQLEGSNANTVKATAVFDIAMKKYYEKKAKDSLTSGSLGPTSGPDLGPASGPLFMDEKNKLDAIVRENKLLRQETDHLRKLAFNHNQHYAPAKRISGPSDMMGGAFDEISKYPIVRTILVIGAFAMILNFVKDQLDKLDRKSNTKRN